MFECLAEENLTKIKKEVFDKGLSLIFQVDGSDSDTKLKFDTFEDFKIAVERDKDPFKPIFDLWSF